MVRRRHDETYLIPRYACSLSRQEIQVCDSVTVATEKPSGWYLRSPGGINLESRHPGLSRVEMGCSGMCSFAMFSRRLCMFGPAVITLAIQRRQLGPWSKSPCKQRDGTEYMLQVRWSMAILGPTDTTQKIADDNVYKSRLGYYAVA